MDNPDNTIIDRPLLELRNVCVCANTDEGERPLLRQVSFTLGHNDIVGLVGESGSGKSVCAQAIMGLLPKPTLAMTGGEIFFDGHRIDKLNPAGWQTIRGKRIAMIFQEPMAALNPVQTIGKQLAEVFTLHFPALDHQAIQQRSIALLEKVGVSEAEQRLQSYPHQLSGGLCQRAMIAMALAGEPDLLIADEPSTALDASTQQQLLALLQELQKKLQMTVLFITHDLALVANWCQHVIVMQNGKVCEATSTENLFTHPAHPYTRSLLAAIQDNECKAPAAQKPVLLELRNVSKSFESPRGYLGRRTPPRQVLNDVSLTIHQGEILALVGESGCGKSTLGRALLFLDPPDKGEIVYQGTLLNSLDKKALRKWRHHVQIIFQDTNESLNPRQTVARILAEPLEIHGMGSRVERENRIRELLDIVELPADAANRFPHEFSGGQRQRIGIARAIALNPSLIVCDEAVSALDVTTQAQIIALLLRLQASLQLSLLFITHDLHVVRKIADRVLVMQKGHIVESNTTGMIFTQPQHAATRQLLAASPRIPDHLKTRP